MSSGVYLSFDYKLTFVYLGSRALCIAWGLRIFVMRMIYRKASQNQPPERAEEQVNLRA
jgi:hypothetical protein